jgi:hypothetical protein
MFRKRPIQASGFGLMFMGVSELGRASCLVGLLKFWFSSKILDSAS